MRKWISILLVITLLAGLAGCASKPSSTTPSASSAAPEATPAATPEPTPAPDAYKDGTYNFESKVGPEGYFVKGSLTIKDNKIESFVADILDSTRENRVFDETYEEVFDNELYKQQCRDDLKGFNAYKVKFVETQNIDDVDVISKATWSYMWFRLAAASLLKQAKQ